jgi:hypothetical protein
MKYLVLIFSISFLYGQNDGRYEVLRSYYFKIETITVNTISWEETGWVYKNGEWVYIQAPTEDVTVVAFSSTPKDGYTKVEAGTRFAQVAPYSQPNSFQGPTGVDGKYITNPQLFNSQITDGVPTKQTWYIDRTTSEINVIIPTQPTPEQDIITYPWAYGNQEPLTHLKTVEQKNFNVDRYYLLEAKDSFDGVCNIVLKISWNFSLNTLPVNQINQTQFCNFSVSAIVTIHDSYIQNHPIEDGQYVHEFSHFNLETTSISFGDSELINNGRFFYNYDQDISVKAFYDSRSVVSGASVTTSRDFVLNVPVYENFTFK